MSKIAILGFGTVGSGVYEVLRTNAKSISRKSGKEIDIKYILDIRDFDSHPEKHLFTKNFDDIVNDAEIETVVEVIGGIKPAYDFTKRALESGKNVVTSNKELVATHGNELLTLAKEKGVKYLFEASVGGGIPIIRPLSRCLAANEITEIAGILNGTTNYILTQMVKNGMDFDTALKNAQAKGYAEANPAADVEGTDACRKIAILSSLAYGQQVECDEISVEGISNLSLADTTLADMAGYTIKLIGHSKKIGEKIEIWVSPMLISKDNSLAGVDDVFNAITVKGNAIGDVMFYGRGAGKLPTASAVAADIIDVAVSDNTADSIMWEESKPGYVVDINETECAYFVKADARAKDAIKTSFGDVDFVECDGEIAVITNKMKYGEIKNITGKIDGILKVLRVLE